MATLAGYKAIRWAIGWAGGKDEDVVAGEALDATWAAGATTPPPSSGAPPVPVGPGVADSFLLLERERRAQHTGGKARNQRCLPHFSHTRPSRAAMADAR